MKDGDQNIGKNHESSFHFSGIRSLAFVPILGALILGTMAFSYQVQGDVKARNELFVPILVSLFSLPVVFIAPVLIAALFSYFVS